MGQNDLCTFVSGKPNGPFRVFGWEAPTLLVQIPDPNYQCFVRTDWVFSQSTYMHWVVLSTYSRLGREIEFTEDKP